MAPPTPRGDRHVIAVSAVQVATRHKVGPTATEMVESKVPAKQFQVNCIVLQTDTHARSNLNQPYVDCVGGWAAAFVKNLTEIASKKGHSRRSISSQHGGLEIGYRRSIVTDPGEPGSRLTGHKNNKVFCGTDPRAHSHQHAGICNPVGQNTLCATNVCCRA